MSRALADPQTVERGNGPCVVLLHCLGASHRLWDRLTGSLQQRFATLAYDLPGHGSAPVPAARYSIADLSDQLAQVLARRGIPRAHLVGMSLGGMIVQDFAARYPMHTAGIVLLDTIARYPESMRSMWSNRATLAREAGMPPLLKPTLEAWFTPAFGTAEDGTIRYVSNMLSRTSPQGYALACETLAEADLETAIDAIRGPTLVLCGTDDAPPFTHAAEEFARRIPGAALRWLAPARHAGLLEQPAQTLAHIERFLGGL